MKLVIFGLTVSSSWGNGHATIWRGLLTALIRRGHRVVFFERDVGTLNGYREAIRLLSGTPVTHEDGPHPSPDEARRRNGTILAGP